jgi:hypothetical protein
VVLAAAGNHIYWAGFDRTQNDTKIGMSRLDGTHKRHLYTFDGDVSGMAPRRRRLYFATGDGLDLIRLGSHRPPKQLVKESGLVDVVVGRGHLFWCNDGPPHSSGSIHIAGMNGARSRPYAIPDLHSPISLALGGGYLYWGNSEARESIGRIKTDGIGAEPSLLSVPGFAVGLAWHAGGLYWASSSLGQPGATNEIGREDFGSEGEPIGGPQTVLPLPADRFPYSLALR